MADVRIDEQVIEVSKKAADEIQPLLDELAALRLKVVELELQRGEAEERAAAVEVEVEPAPLRPPRNLKVQANPKALERLKVSPEDLVRVARTLDDLSDELESLQLRVRMRFGEAWIEHDSLPGGMAENVVARCMPHRIFAGS